MPEELVMRGKTASGLTETLNFSGHTPGYAYRLISFDIYPSNDIGTVAFELAATITAAGSEENPSNPNFKNEGLIGSTLFFGSNGSNEAYSQQQKTVINDMFYITQDLIISCIDTFGGSPQAVNWQCKFEKVKLSAGAEAVANFKQFTIYDE